MRYAWFPGCKIPFFLEHYNTSSRAVLKALNVVLEDIEFNCCGYPIRNLNFDAFVLSGARNLALAEKKGLNILTPCKCCFGNLKHAQHSLDSDLSLRDEVNNLLAEEGLRYNGKTTVSHMLSALRHEIGLEAIQYNIKKQYHDLKIAAHYGCHALRPSGITEFDNPLAPTIFEDLVAVTGAQSVDWSRRLDCCGNPILSKNNDMSIKLMRNKLDSAREASADFICSACTYCQIQFDTVQQADIEKNNHRQPMPSILFPQLLGLSLGLSEKKLGLTKNKIDLSSIKNHIC